MATLKANSSARYKADRARVGWVIEITGESARVFVDGAPKLVPVTELEPVPDLVEMSPDEFRAALTLRRLEHPLTDQLLSYKASKTRLYYHQFLPVKKMLESPEPRLLVADEVGTGKTIEAGLIWAELESRTAHGLDNVWIVCPKSLVGKWREEMLQRFDFRLEVLLPEGLRQALVSLERDGVLPPRFAKCIVNLELIRAEEHVTRLAETEVAWDLVIFDEAHHLRNTDTRSHALARLMCERSKAAVLLTATPLQTSLEDIVHLMEALGVDAAADSRLLEEQMHWDMELNDWIGIAKGRPPDWRQQLDRALFRLEAEGRRDRPGWDKFKELVTESDLEDIGQRTVVIDAARDLQVLSPYMTRTLRSDVDEDRPTREAITRTVRFSPEEESFYRAVYRICLDRAGETGAPPGFVTQMPERRTASCAPAVASEILQYAAEDEEDEDKASFSPAEARELEPLARAALESNDEKLEALCEILKHVLGDLGADRAMIFSTFRGTLRYLASALAERGYSLELMYGPTPVRDEDCRRSEKSRERIAAEFRQGKFQILLASEVAGEGLDFEHCHVLVNYDLPWNPMRVEQRIGRCDRIGQRSDKVYIGSLASEGTIEQRILSRLYERLRVFERAMGDLEVILGEKIASFEREVFRRDLSPRQQEERLERISRTIENRRLQQGSIGESSVISTAGLQLIESDQEEIKQAESAFLSPEDVGEFVYDSLRKSLPNSMRRTLSRSGFEVHANEDLSDALQELLRAYPASHHARTEIVRFLNRLKERKKMPVSFLDTDEDVEFVHARHPLTLLARHLSRGVVSDIPYCVGEITSAEIESPAVLVWAVSSLEGYTNRAELTCALVDWATGEVERVSAGQAQEWIRELSPLNASGRDIADVQRLKARAEEALWVQFDEVKAAFNLRNDLMADKAKHAVRSHAQRTLDWLDRQLERGDLKDNIRNMHRGRRRNLEAETKSKLEEIELREQVRSSLEVIGAAVLHPSEPDTRTA